MCIVDDEFCGCIGHRWPGVDHFMPCCDEPHITQEEYEARLEADYVSPY